MPSDQSRIIERAKFTYSPLSKAFEKQTKTTEEQGKRQIDDLSKNILVSLTNKYNHKSDCKKTLEKICKEKLGKMEEWTGDIEYDDLIYYSENEAASKYFTDFENGAELLNKVKFGQIILKDAKKVQDIFNRNLSKVSKRRFKSEEQKSALKHI